MKEEELGSAVISAKLNLIKMVRYTETKLLVLPLLMLTKKHTIIYRMLKIQWINLLKKQRAESGPYRLSSKNMGPEINLGWKENVVSN